ncbi:MAG: hypothetical protein WDO73_00225 [Ignavibacteriota bacterium]
MPAFGGELDVRPEAGREHHHVRRKIESADFRAATQFHPVGSELTSHQAGPPLVIAQQEILRTLHHGNLKPVPAERVGGPQGPIYPAPTTTPLARFLLFDKGAQACGVVERVQREDVRRQRGRSTGIATRSGGDHQVLIAYALAGLQRDFALRMADGRHASAGSHIDFALFAEVLGRVND